MHLQTIQSTSIERHVHAAAYASIVLSGGYEEAGDNGRFRVSAGDVIFHERFEGHLDRFMPGQTVVLNLALENQVGAPPGLARVADADRLAQLAEKDQREALHLLLASATPMKATPFDWEDELCRALLEEDTVRLADWCRRQGLAPWRVSRGFKQVFGVTPEFFRARSRARRAFRRICASRDTLALIAQDAGFSDQAHMTRAVRQLTGQTPATWQSAVCGGPCPCDYGSRRSF